MTRIRRRSVLLVLAGLTCFAGLGPACAQVAQPDSANPVPYNPGLFITSDPPGAVVSLKGQYAWMGQTPWNLVREIQGLYQVEARAPGYETWQGESVFGPGGVQALQISLARKTRFKAFARSLLLPGWGQIYLGARGKGWLILTGETLALGGLLWMNERYQDKVDRFEDAVALRNAAQQQEERSRLTQQAKKAGRDADRAYDRRRVALLGAAGIYAVSLVDVLFFSPAGAASPTQQSDNLDSRPGARAPAQGWAASLQPGPNPRLGITYRWQ